MRPDTPREGAERPPRPGETPDELSEPLRGQARESGLIMRPPPYTPNTLYSLEATEYAQQHGKFMEFHHAAYKAFWDDRKDIGQIETLADIANNVGLDGTDMTQNLEQGAHSQTVIAQYREAPPIRHKRHPHLPSRRPIRQPQTSPNVHRRPPPPSIQASNAALPKPVTPPASTAPHRTSPPPPGEG